MKGLLIIILARGGSTRIKNKNIKPIQGVPLIDWTIYDAINLDIAKDIYVSTDDDSIKEVVGKHKEIGIIDRPPNISHSTSTSEEAILHALDYLNDKYEYVLNLQCTTPFRDVENLKQGIYKFKERNADSMLFTTMLDDFIWSPNLQPINYDYNNRPRTQDKKWELIECGDYLFKSELIQKENNRLGGKIINHNRKCIHCEDIDVFYDLERCRALAEYFDINPYK